jgi:hypothetical protein
MRCFTRTCRVVAGSPSLKLGRRRVTGVSQVMRPAATSLARRRVARALVLEAIMKRVSASTGLVPPSSRVPKPPAKTTLPPWTIPSATPGMPRVFRPCSTKRFRSARRARVSRWAFLPAKDSRACPLGKRRSKISFTWAARFSPTGWDMA